MTGASTLHQASCVAIDGRALMIEGAPGTGKTSLLLALLDRGAQLIGDDGVTLRLQAGAIVAAPPPHTAGMIEVRNVGIIERPCISAPLNLVIRLDRMAPRHVEETATIAVMGTPIPFLTMFPFDAATAIRVEIAMMLYGIGNSANGGCR